MGTNSVLMIIRPILLKDSTQLQDILTIFCILTILFEFTSVSYGFVSSKIYDKHDDFEFDIVNFPFLAGHVPRRPSDGVYI